MAFKYTVRCLNEAERTRERRTKTTFYFFQENKFIAFPESETSVCFAPHLTVNYVMNIIFCPLLVLKSEEGALATIANTERFPLLIL